MFWGRSSYLVRVFQLMYILYLFCENDIEELSEAGHLASEVHHSRHGGGDEAQLGTALQVGGAFRHFPISIPSILATKIQICNANSNKNHLPLNKN